MAEEDQRRWYALYVRSRHEKMVHAQLDAKAEDVFLPVYNSRHKWADRWKTVSLPLFPGYVFCRFDTNRRTSVMTTSGIIDVVRHGSEPAAIDSSEIEALKRVVASPVLMEPYPDIFPGEAVTMSDGPLKGLSGTLMEVRKGLRLVVSVQLLHRSVLIEIDRDWIVCGKLPKLRCPDFSAPHLGAGLV